MVKTAGAYSTQRRDNEDAESLAEKCREAADQWGEVADQLWNGRHAEKTEQAVS
jgi:hypothetical protein